MPTTPRGKYQGETISGSYFRRRGEGTRHTLHAPTELIEINLGLVSHLWALQPRPIVAAKSPHGEGPSPFPPATLMRDIHVPPCAHSPSDRKNPTPSS